MLALVVRLLGLGADSLWSDEASTWDFARLSWSDTASGAGDMNTGAYFLLAKIAMVVLGDGEAALRLPAALLTSAAVPLIGLLGTCVGGPRTGVAAAFLGALSTAQIHYGQEARSYGLVIFAAAATLVSLARVIDMSNPTDRAAPPGAHVTTCPARARDGVVFGFALALLLHAHPFGVLVAAALTLYVAIRWRADTRFPAAAALGLTIAATLYLPLVPHLVDRAHRLAGHFWIDPVSFGSIAKAPARLVVFAPGRFSGWLVTVALFVAVTRLPSRWRALTVLVACGVWLGPALAAYVAPPFFVIRYAFALAPLLVVALAALATRWWQGRASVVAGALLISAAAVDATSYHLERPHRPPWREAGAAFVAATRAGAQPIVFVSAQWPDTESIIHYYVRGLDVLVVYAAPDTAGDWSWQGGALADGPLVVIAHGYLKPAVRAALAGHAYAARFENADARHPFLIEVLPGA